MTVVKSSRDSVLHSVDVRWTETVPPYLNVSSQQFPVAWNDTVIRQDNIPDWRDRIAQGRNASTWYEGNDFHVKASPGVTTLSYRFANGNVRKYVANGDVMSMCYQPSELLLPVANDIELARTQAEIAFTKDFRNKTRHWQSGVFAGELFQLAKMLASPLKSLRTGVTKLHDDLFYYSKKATGRGSRRQQLLDVKDAIAGTYLEWQYGIKPTISDCNDAAKAFRAMASARTFDIIRCRGDGVYTRYEEVRREFIPGGNFAGFGSYQDCRRTHHVDCTLRGAWRSDKADSTLPLPMQFGLDLGSLLPTAWELVPWSFIIDYFSNMGEVLDVWGMRFIDFVWLNETLRLVTTYEDIPPQGFHRTSLFNPVETTFSTTVPYSVHVRKRVSRRPYDNSWTPRIQGKFPGLGSQKWLNMAALASMSSVPSHISRLG